MKKSIFLTGIALMLGLLIGINTANAEEKTKAPRAATNKMMLEHMGIDCTVCHGENGPKGIKMGNHPKQQCTDCHVLGVDKPLTRREKRTSLAREMMLKHGAALNCRICHGEHGTGGMMLEHVGMDCQTCHVIDNK